MPTTAISVDAAADDKNEPDLSFSSMSIEVRNYEFSNTILIYLIGVKQTHIYYHYMPAHCNKTETSF